MDLNSLDLIHPFFVVLKQLNRRGSSYRASVIRGSGLPLNWLSLVEREGALDALYKIVQRRLDHEFPIYKSDLLQFKMKL